MGRRRQAVATLVEVPRSDVEFSAHFASFVAVGGRVSYRSISGSSRRCAECTWIVHEAHGKGPSIGIARCTRTVDAGTMDLCVPHKLAWELKDPPKEQRHAVRR